MDKEKKGEGARGPQGALQGGPRPVLRPSINCGPMRKVSNS